MFTQLRVSNAAAVYAAKEVLAMMPEEVLNSGEHATGTLISYTLEQTCLASGVLNMVLSQQLFHGLAMIHHLHMSLNTW